MPLLVELLVDHWMTNPVVDAVADQVPRTDLRVITTVLYEAMLTQEAKDPAVAIRPLRWQVLRWVLAARPV